VPRQYSMKTYKLSDIWASLMILELAVRSMSGQLSTVAISPYGKILQNVLGRKMRVSSWK